MADYASLIRPTPYGLHKRSDMGRLLQKVTPDFTSLIRATLATDQWKGCRPRAERPADRIDGECRPERIGDFVEVDRHCGKA